MPVATLKGRSAHLHGSCRSRLLVVLLVLMQLVVQDRAENGLWPYSPRSNWSAVPKFYFATTNLTSDDTIDAASMAFLQQFSLIVMPKIQGPNTRNLTDPERPTPGCCAEDRIGRAAAIIKRQHHNPDNLRVLMYISSCRLFPYYRLTERFDEASDLLHHQNGSVYSDTVGGPGQQWWYDVHTLDFTREDVTDKYLRGVRETLMQHRSTIDGVFADSSGDLRVRGGANMHLNQTTQFEAAWDAGHAHMLTRMQAVVTSVLGPRGLLVANNADRSNVHGRNFENLGPTASPYVTDETLANQSFAGDSIEALQHEEEAGRLALIRGGYYTAPGSAGWEKGYANCLPPSAFKDGVWDDHASHIFNRTLAAFLIGAGEHAFFQCTPGYVGNYEYQRSFEDYSALRQPLGQPVAAARNISGVWSREFKAGVRVFLDAANWSRPCIKWNDGSVTGSATDCASYKDATASQV